MFVHFFLILCYILLVDSTFVEPRLMLDMEAAEAAAGLSELSAWWRMLHRWVTEVMMVWRMDRMPERASVRCFWSTLTCN